MDNLGAYIKIFSLLAGGVGIFLLGMRFLSDGLQAVAGDRLRALVGMATNNRFFGLAVGVFVTGLIQSSSVTTVLVVSFVDGGLMTLAQAVGVIMGANIGTTITGWLLTLQIDKYGVQIAGVGALVYMFCKKEKIKYTSLAIIGIGFVFLGMFFMKSAMSPIREMPEFVEAFKAFNANSYLGILGCALVGCIMTCIVQASAATIAITMALATQGLISFEAAAALVLGENVGTTITAILASLGTSNNAKRAAYFHSLFNCIGVFYITLLFKPFIAFVSFILGTFFGITDLNDTAKIAFGIAAVHSTFNIFNTLIFLGPCRQMARFLESAPVTKFLIAIKFLRKEKKQKNQLAPMLARLDRNAEGSYVKFIDFEANVQQVLFYMGNLLKSCMERLENSIKLESKNEEENGYVFEAEKECDNIKSKLLAVLSSFVGSDEASALIQYRIFAYERIFDNLESVSDYATQILKLRLRIFDNKTDLQDYQKNGLIALHKEIESAFEKLIPLLYNQIPIGPKHSALKDQDKLYKKIKEDIRALRAKYWEEASKTNTNPIVNDAYSNMLASYRKIRDHLRSVSNVMFGVDRD